jgi:hypothetical protein
MIGFSIGSILTYWIALIILTFYQIYSLEKRGFAVLSEVSQVNPVWSGHD